MIAKKSKNKIYSLLKSDSGVVTVEATISLSAFMFLMVTLLTIINICVVQAKVVNAINATAKEISQYTYLYSLTGLNSVQSQLAQNGDLTQEQINGVIGGVQDTFAQLDGLQGNLDNTKSQAATAFSSGNFDLDALASNVEDIKNNLSNVQSSASGTMEQIEKMAENPKQLIFGLASMAGSDLWDVAKSRIIAASLANVMSRKHFISGSKDEVNSYLAGLGVVPRDNGNYIDFTRSTLFPKGSNIITITADYDVKVIALLPIDFTFHFCQTSITYGWMCGETTTNDSEKTAEKYITETNSTLWTEAPISERSYYIRHMAMATYGSEKYYKVSGSDQGLMYSPDENELVMVGRSLNPLYSEPGTKPKTIDDIDEEFLKSQISQLCGEMSQNRGADNVTVKETTNGKTELKDYSIKDAKLKIEIAIPEDDGLKEKMESILSECETHGVTVEFSPCFGKGAAETTTALPQDNGGEEG